MDIDKITIFTLLAPEEQELVEKYQAPLQEYFLLMVGVPDDKILDVRNLLQKLYPEYYINVQYRENGAVLYRSYRVP